ncbi:hypothetical protein AGMMS49587_13040 [Spirochaetia bacterium]|nr:hypothetical protein AGMMS49587_13040 [Spirochaetia bacterium]
MNKFKNRSITIYKEDIEKCLAAGMDGHVGKPLDFDEVMTILRKYLAAGI